MTVAHEVVDRPLIDVVYELIDADKELTDAAKYLVVAALEGEDALRDQLGGASTSTKRQTSAAPITEPVGAFLTSISVAGFRGIGPSATLDLHPAPGITIVSGRNGSGKSSFAEALEFAVTGKSYRWQNKAKLWVDSWRNLHASNPCEVRIGLTVEGSQPTVVGVDWTADSALTDCDVWTQTGKEKRVAGTDHLGWAKAVELHRPILSYDEIGGLVEDSPSVLYDALAKLLGLNEIADAGARLGSELKAAKLPRQSATELLKQLRVLVDESTDSRAVAAAALLRKRAPDTVAVLALATGSDTATSAPLAALRSVASLTSPRQDMVDAIAARVRSAVAFSIDLADSALKMTERRTDLLDAALHFHSESGDTACPVCEVGTLDAGWAERARTAVADQNKHVDRYRESRRELESAQRNARDLLDAIASVPAGVELDSLAGYQQAVLDARTAPAAVSDLADHIERTVPPVIAAADVLREEASAIVVAQEDKWTPLAGRIAAWVTAENDAQAMDAQVKELDSAKKWVTAREDDLRNKRLEPIAEQARSIWAELRQESNVDIGSIRLEGSRTHRKAVLQGSVDGVATEALSVMSQGELHALALALFIPRATTPNSPFRFIVLDDPIQAMDPAKIDGFIKVLSTLAETRQVIVFSHDDRLAGAIRQLAVDARLVEVTRETGSAVSVKETLNQAMRYVHDVRALILDDQVPDNVKRRAAPGLFRMALESAAQQSFYATRHRAGESREQTEALWMKADRTSSKVALAVHGDAQVDLSNWRRLRTPHGPTMDICRAGVHGATVDIDRLTISNLQKTVEYVLAL